MQIKTFFGDLYNQFFKNDTTTLAASLAFYTVLSLAPILILFVAVSSYFTQDMQTRFLAEAQTLVGVEGARTVELIFKSAHENREFNTLAGVFGLATLLFSASFVFGELRYAFNRIFRVDLTEETNLTVVRTLVLFVRDRLLHIGFVLSFIFALIVALVASSLILSAFHFADRSVVRALKTLLSSLSYVLVFMSMFHYLPSCRPGWRVSVRGGVLTAIMFVLGKELIGFYLVKSAIGSAYGAAGSVVLLLAWVYYSALVILVGAEISSLLFYGERGGPCEKSSA